METGETTEGFTFEDFSTEPMGYMEDDSYPASKFWLASMVPQLDDPLSNLGYSGVDKLANTRLIVSTSLQNSESFKEASVLPPCRICGEVASGFHYGANTCEACKVGLLPLDVSGLDYLDRTFSLGTFERFCARGTYQPEYQW